MPREAPTRSAEPDAEAAERLLAGDPQRNIFRAEIAMEAIVAAVIIFRLHISVPAEGALQADAGAPTVARLVIRDIGAGRRVAAVRAEAAVHVGALQIDQVLAAEDLSDPGTRLDVAIDLEAVGHGAGGAAFLVVGQVVAAEDAHHRRAPDGIIIADLATDEAVLVVIGEARVAGPVGDMGPRPDPVPAAVQFDARPGERGGAAVLRHGWHGSGRHEGGGKNELVHGISFAKQLVRTWTGPIRRSGRSAPSVSRSRPVRVGRCVDHATTGGGEVMRRVEPNGTG